MLETELLGAKFLVPTAQVHSSDGYMDRVAFCDALKAGARIGHYSEDGMFWVDQTLTFIYQRIIPHIADALAADTRSAEYQRYKLAALEKGTLQLHLEWPLFTCLQAKNLSLSCARLLQEQAGLPVLLVDMQGPAYEVVVPDTVEAFIARLGLEVDTEAEPERESMLA